MSADDHRLRAAFAAADVALPAPAGAPITLARLQARLRRRQASCAALLLVGLGLVGSSMAAWQRPVAPSEPGAESGSAAGMLASGVPASGMAIASSWDEWGARLARLQALCRESAAAASALDEQFAAAGLAAARTRAIDQHLTLVCAGPSAGAVDRTPLQGTAR